MYFHSQPLYCRKFCQIWNILGGSCPNSCSSILFTHCIVSFPDPTLMRERVNKGIIMECFLWPWSLCTMSCDCTCVNTNLCKYYQWHMIADSEFEEPRIEITNDPRPFFTCMMGSGKENIIYIMWSMQKAEPLNTYKNLGHLQGLDLPQLSNVALCKNWWKWGDRYDLRTGVHMVDSVFLWECLLIANRESFLYLC